VLRATITQKKKAGMQLKTILNRVQKFKSFVYTRVHWAGSAETPELEVEVAERANGRALCSGCGCQSPGYDRLATRRFEFVPRWGIKVFLVYAPRRVDCPGCGVRVEHMPWASGKNRLTQAYAWFLARWARRLSWKEVAQVFRASWQSVFRSVEMAVEWGRAHQDLGGVEAIGVDEIAWKKGHQYLTLVYQIDPHCKRLLWVGRERKTKTLAPFLPLVRCRAQPTTQVHLLGYVEAVSEGHCQESGSGRARARPLPHHGAFEPRRSMRYAPRRSRN
jgi:hypothetical protein